MAFVMTPEEPKEDKKVIGMKLDISPEILPRDTSIGTKLLMLVPSEAKNVREVKSYIANFVLKTPSPFHFFVGEYRIRDEEDVQIFSIINEPCRLVPVPLPRSALSSTPKPKSRNKRVTFFDGDLSASPVHDAVGNGTDVIDHTQTGRSIHSPEEQLAIAATSIENLTTNNQINLSGSVSERKKKRRRKHRNKKSNSSFTEKDNQDESSSVFNGSESETPGQVTVVNLVKLEPNTNSTSNNFERNQLEVLNEETESEDETSGISSEVKDFEFVTPKTEKMSRKRIDSSELQGHSKKKKLSDSAFESSCSFVSPISTSDDCNSSNVKTRQDTPIVPRVIKNPKMFDSARKIIDLFSPDSNQKDDFNSKSKSSIKKSKTSLPESGVCNDEDYKNLSSILSPEEINIGDRIAFKVLELDERYNPSVSTYKEGVISEIEGMKFRITYTKNKPILRTGRYDIALDDEESEEKPSQTETVDLLFSELLEPKRISQKSSDAQTCPLLDMCFTPPDTI